MLKKWNLWRKDTSNTRETMPSIFCSTPTAKITVRVFCFQNLIVTLNIVSYNVGVCTITNCSHLLWHGNLWRNREGREGDISNALHAKESISGEEFYVLYLIRARIQYLSYKSSEWFKRWHWRLNWAWLEAQWVFSLASPSSVALRSSTTWSGIFR